MESMRRFSFCTWNPCGDFYSMHGFHVEVSIPWMQSMTRFSFRKWNSCRGFHFVHGIHAEIFIPCMKSKQEGSFHECKKYFVHGSMCRILFYPKSKSEKKTLGALCSTTFLMEIITSIFRFPPKDYHSQSSALFLPSFYSKSSDFILCI